MRSARSRSGKARCSTFTPIPTTYLAPFFDTPSFGPEDGELTGQTLLEGTYTVGFTIGWNYTVDGQFKSSTTNATFDFVLGNSGVVEPRQVVKLENCNRCHDQLQVHGGTRQEVVAVESLTLERHEQRAGRKRASVSADGIEVAVLAAKARRYGASCFGEAHDRHRFWSASRATVTSEKGCRTPPMSW